MERTIRGMTSIRIRIEGDDDVSQRDSVFTMISDDRLEEALPLACHLYFGYREKGERQ